MSATRDSDTGRQAIPLSTVFKSVATVFAELVEGASKDGGWVLNRGDEGLLKSLDRLSCHEASAKPAGGGASIAAHVDHLRYGLSLLNRWGAGEEDPFSDSDYSASWRRSSVSDAEWKRLREQLLEQAHQWLAVLQAPRELNEMELNGLVASAAHLAYHIGSIRQIDRTTRGPSATD